MTLNDVMAVTLRYFTEVGKLRYRKRSMAEFMQESIVFCSACTMSSQRKFTFAISSPDEFLVLELSLRNAPRHGMMDASYTPTLGGHNCQSSALSLRVFFHFSYSSVQ